VKKTIAAIAVIPAALVALSACGTTASVGEKQVVYTVTADSGKASVTYSADGKGSTQQENAASLPWTHKMTLKQGLVDLNVLTVIAQNSGDGNVACSISVDGKEVKTATSSGQFAIATCTSDIK
jgi:hypothetical protein